MMEQNPLLTLRLTSGLTQEVIGQNAHVSKQYISKCERGMADRLNHRYLTALVKASGIDLKPHEVENLYRSWQVNRREETVRFTDPLPIKEAPVAAVSQRPGQPQIKNFQKFKVWRETYWKTAYEFSEAFCIRDSEVIKYEKGRMYGMPGSIKQVLEPFGLLENFDTNRR